MLVSSSLLCQTMNIIVGDKDASMNVVLNILAIDICISISKLSFHQENTDNERERECRKLLKTKYS